MSDQETVETPELVQAAPPLPASFPVTGVSLTCPGCGTVSRFDEIRRDASEFCRQCDYPLFWARGAELGVSGASASLSERGLRRLPGTAGRVELATIVCWSCEEPNRITAVLCIRCGVDLRPKPPEPEPVLVFEPEPLPAPPPKREIWPWVLLALMVIGTIIGFAIALWPD